MFGVCLQNTRSDSCLGQWSYVLSHWTADAIWIVGAGDLPPHNPLREATLIETAEALPDRTLVMVSPQNARFRPGEISLYGFTHPDDCVYLFGSDHSHLSEDQMGSRESDFSIYIPTDTEDQLYCYVAAAVVLSHRAAQHG